jgi:hypothetical protein
MLTMVMPQDGRGVSNDWRNAPRQGDHMSGYAEMCCGRGPMNITFCKTFRQFEMTAGFASARFPEVNLAVSSSVLGLQAHEAAASSAD